jgi:hypothetical protein
MVQFGAIDGASKSIILQKDAPLHESFVVSSESKEAFPPSKSFSSFYCFLLCEQIKASNATTTRLVG